MWQWVRETAGSREYLTNRLDPNNKFHKTRTLMIMTVTMKEVSLGSMTLPMLSGRSGVMLEHGYQHGGEGMRVG